MNQNGDQAKFDPKGGRMPRAFKEKHTREQKRQFMLIKEGYAERGMSQKEATLRALATINKIYSGGEKRAMSRRMIEKAEKSWEAARSKAEEAWNRAEEETDNLSRLARRSIDNLLDNTRKGWHLPGSPSRKILTDLES